MLSRALKWPGDTPGGQSWQMKASISMGLHNSDRTKITAGGVGGIVFQFFSVFFLFHKASWQNTHFKACISGKEK
jgi:hypothetical protein